MKCRQGYDEPAITPQENATDAQGPGDTQHTVPAPQEGHQFTALDAYLTAQLLAQHGHTNSDAVTHTDLHTAADLAGAPQPTAHDLHTIRLALDAITS